MSPATRLIIFIKQTYSIPPTDTHLMHNNFRFFIYITVINSIQAIPIAERRRNSTGIADQPNKNHERVSLASVAQNGGRAKVSRRLAFPPKVFMSASSSVGGGGGALLTDCQESMQSKSEGGWMPCDSCTCAQAHCTASMSAGQANKHMHLKNLKMFQGNRINCSTLWIL